VALYKRIIIIFLIMVFIVAIAVIVKTETIDRPCALIGDKIRFTGPARMVPANQHLFGASQKSVAKATARARI